MVIIAVIMVIITVVMFIIIISTVVMVIIIIMVIIMIIMVIITVILVRRVRCGEVSKTWREGGSRNIIIINATKKEAQEY